MKIDIYFETDIFKGVWITKVVSSNEKVVNVFRITTKEGMEILLLTRYIEYERKACDGKPSWANG